MTAAKVIDASALAAVLFEEPKADLVEARIENARLFAPPLLGFELANVCLQKSRRHPEQAAALAAAFGMRRDFAIQDVPVDLDAVLALAGATGLTAYDASYLWLARHLDLELVTLDKRLAVASSARPS